MDPYVTRLVGTEAYVCKALVSARVVVVLRGHIADRRLQLIPQPSRVVTRGGVHELITTDEDGVRAGAPVGRIAYVGFVEFDGGGVLLVGDEVRLEGRLLGHLAGFDLTHMPNHMNIVIAVPRVVSGEELGLELGGRVTFGNAPAPPEAPVR